MLNDLSITGGVLLEPQWSLITHLIRQSLGPWSHTWYDNPWVISLRNCTLFITLTWLIDFIELIDCIDLIDWLRWLDWLIALTVLIDYLVWLTPQSGPVLCLSVSEHRSSWVEVSCRNHKGMLTIELTCLQGLLSSVFQYLITDWNLISDWKQRVPWKIGLK